ncbi:ferrous iron transport protein A [Candidatus Bipolaricaulota bacterium]|nr:ferrous iron transport protein A [Candidatus Bipolaricaulota bacterium]
MTLDELKPGQEARILDVKVEGATGQRLLDMGFISGTRVKVVRNAPFVDPIELLVRGYHVSVRHSEAKGVEVAPV